MDFGKIGTFKKKRQLFSLNSHPPRQCSNLPRKPIQIALIHTVSSHAFFAFKFASSMERSPTTKRTFPTPPISCSWASDPQQPCSLVGPDGTVYQADTKPWTTFGREAGFADHVLPSGSVSRLHLAIVHHGDGRVYAIDLKSTHGSTLDGQPLPGHKPTKLQVRHCRPRSHGVRLPRSLALIFPLHSADSDVSPPARSSPSPRRTA